MATQHCNEHEFHSKDVDPVSVASLWICCYKPGIENIAIFSKFWIYIGYFRYFHFTALDLVMSIERLVFKCVFQNVATKNNNNSNIVLCSTCIAQ